MTIAIIVHGGAKTVTDDKIQANNDGCLAAVKAGWAVLTKGGSAIDAVEAAIRVLENDPTFNASRGATLDTEGKVSLDAAMMEGNNYAWGGVAAVKKVRHPISVARKILEKKPMLLASQGAEHFAAEHGAEMCEPNSLITEEQQQHWEEEEKEKVIDRPQTVGCVALDSSGTIVAGTSTGGVTAQLPDRVGDSVIVGSGLYADSKVGGCSTTGDGESIIPVVLAKTAIDLLHGRHPEAASQMAIEIFKQKINGEAGCILIDDQGRVGWAYNSEDMAVAYMTADMKSPEAFTNKEAELASKAEYQNYSTDLLSA
jgi:beta-aspartyl-peptidase (threonine type)